MVKPAGIIRCFDNLGRIIIPREIRRQLEIKGEQPMEIHTDDEGRIVLKKYLGEEGHYGKYKNDIKRVL